MPFVGLKVGELLDPLNDAIERLSSVLVWAIGSLFLQRVALEVASSSVSKWSFLAVGLIVITTSLLGTWQRFRHLFGAWERFRDLSVRLFIYLAVFRFIVPVFAMIGFLVSHLLFDTEIHKNKEDLSQFSAGISVDISTPPLDTQESDEQQALKASELDQLRQRMASYMQEAEALDAQIQELSGEVGMRRYLPERLGGVSPDEQQALKASELPELDELLKTHSVLMQEAEALDAQIQELSGEVGMRRYLPERLGGVSPGEQFAAAEARREEIRREVEAIESRVRAMEREQLVSAEARREEIRREMETVESEIRAVEEELECIEKRRAGEDCASLLGKLSAMGGEGYARVRDLIGKAGGVVITIVKLTIVIIVKNILLPMAFLMIAVKYALPVARYWARLTSNFRRDVKELGNTLLPDAGSPLLKEKSEDT